MRRPSCFCRAIHSARGRLGRVKRNSPSSSKRNISRASASKRASSVFAARRIHSGRKRASGASGSSPSAMTEREIRRRASRRRRNTRETSPGENPSRSSSPQSRRAQRYGIRSGGVRRISSVSKMSTLIVRQDAGTRGASKLSVHPVTNAASFRNLFPSSAFVRPCYPSPFAHAVCFFENESASDEKNDAPLLTVLSADLSSKQAMARKKMPSKKFSSRLASLVNEFRKTRAIA